MAKGHAAVSTIAKAGIVLSDRSRWTQGALARNARGRPTCFKRAASWDILGAILAQGSQTESAMRRDGMNSENATATGYVQQAASRLFKMSAETVNDTMGHEQVLAVLRLAWKMENSAQKK